MDNSPALEERITNLEYFVFEQLPPKMAAMDFGASQIYALTQANGETIARLRVNMAALELSLHADMTAFKADIGLQGDDLRKQIGSTRAEVLTSMTAFRDRVDQRFERVDGKIGALKEDTDRRFDALDSKVDTLDSKVDTLIAEIRNDRN